MRGIVFLANLQNDKGQILTPEELLTSKSFAITFKEYQTVIKAIPSRSRQCIKCHFEWSMLQKNIVKAKNTLIKYFWVKGLFQLMENVDGTPILPV